MKITVYSFKGGVGKTRIAVNLALTMSYGVITNDIANPLQVIFPRSNLLKLGIEDSIPNIPNDYNVIFDFGGYAEARVISALRQSDWVLIPFTNVVDELEITAVTVEAVREYNKNIIMILNKAVKGDYEMVKELLCTEYGFNYPLFGVKKSRALKNIFVSGISVEKARVNSPLLNYHYREIAEQFEEIIEYMEERIKGVV